MTPRFYNFDILTCIHFHLNICHRVIYLNSWDNVNPCASTSSNVDEEFIDDGEQMLDNEFDVTNTNVGPEKRRGRGRTWSGGN